MPLGDSITDGFNLPPGYREDLYTLLTNAGYTFTFVGSATDRSTPPARRRRPAASRRPFRLRDPDLGVVARRSVQPGVSLHRAASPTISTPGSVPAAPMPTTSS